MVARTSGLRSARASPRATSITSWTVRPSPVTITVRMADSLPFPGRGRRCRCRPGWPPGSAGGGPGHGGSSAGVFLDRVRDEFRNPQRQQVVAPGDVDLAAPGDAGRDRLIAFDQRRIVLVPDEQHGRRRDAAETVERRRPWLLVLAVGQPRP